MKALITVLTNNALVLQHITDNQYFEACANLHRGSDQDALRCNRCDPASMLVHLASI